MSRPFTRASSDCVAAIAALLVRVSLCVLIGERYDALLRRSAVGERQAGPIARIFKEAFPPAEEDWMDHEPVFVDQLALTERLDQFAAAVDQDVLPGLLFQVAHCLDRVALKQRGVPFERLLQRRRRNVLGKAVHPVGKTLFIGHRRPDGGEALIRDTSEQQRITRKQLVVLHRLEFVIPVGTGPASDFLLLTLGIFHLHSPVNREIFRRDDSSHLTLLWVRRCGSALVDCGANDRLRAPYLYPLSFAATRPAGQEIRRGTKKSLASAKRTQRWSASIIAAARVAGLLR